MPKCDFKKVAKKLSCMGVSCNFSARFQNTFSYEHLWRAASAFHLLFDSTEVFSKSKIFYIKGSLI